MYRGLMHFSSSTAAAVGVRWKGGWRDVDGGGAEVWDEACDLALHRRG